MANTMLCVLAVINVQQQEIGSLTLTIILARNWFCNTGATQAPGIISWILRNATNGFAPSVVRSLTPNLNIIFSHKKGDDRCENETIVFAVSFANAFDWYLLAGLCLRSED